jgi:chitin synthase
MSSSLLSRRFWHCNVPAPWLSDVNPWRFDWLPTDPWEPQDFKSNVMVMVPCYNEGEKELRKTINSILDSNYPPDHKVLMVVADGIITGRGEYFNTPATLARLLGFTLDSKRD